jgi:hypothetical protein
MDHKTFKTDLTYFCKRAQKDGKVLCTDCDNLSIDVDGKFVLEGQQAHPLEFFAVGKGYTPDMGMVRAYKEGYGFNISGVIDQQAQISMEDIYSFMNGFEHEIVSIKNEFYNLGVYIREKFMPPGFRDKPVVRPTYQSPLSKNVVRKFYFVNTKANVGVYEIEAAQMTGFYLRSEEKRFKVQAPEFLNTEELMSWAVYDSAEECRVHAEESIRNGFVAGLRKRKIEYTEEDVQASINSLKVVML